MTPFYENNSILPSYHIKPVYDDDEINKTPQTQNRSNNIYSVMPYSPGNQQIVYENPVNQTNNIRKDNYFIINNIFQQYIIQFVNF